MPSRFEKYRVKDGLTKLGEAFFNPVFQDIDLRLVGIEALRISWEEAVRAVTEYGLIRVNEVIGPTLLDATSKADEIEAKRLAATTALTALMAAIGSYEANADADIVAWKSAQLAAIESWKDSITPSLPSLQGDISTLQSGKLDKSGGSMTGALNEAAAVTLASAAAVNIGAAASNTISITGATTIMSFDVAPSGVTRRLVFSGSLTLTHNAASLMLPGAANIITTVGDVAEFQSLGGGNWRCIAFMAAQGSGGEASAVLVSANTTLKAGRRYRIVASSDVTLTLPASPAVGDAIAILDGNSIAGGFNHTISRNGQSIEGYSEDLVMNSPNVDVRLWFDGSTWRIT